MIPVMFSSVGSVEPDVDRSAGNDEGPRGRPAGGHRGSDPGHDHGVHPEGQLSDPGCVTRQH